MPPSIEGAGEEIGFHPTGFYGLNPDPELIQFKSHGVLYGKQAQWVILRLSSQTVLSWMPRLP